MPSPEDKARENIDRLLTNGRAAEVVEAKKDGVTLTGVETQSEKYTKGLPKGLSAWAKTLPFSYESNGIEAHFTKGLDPLPRSRRVFSFHRPDTSADWLESATGKGAEAAEKYGSHDRTFLARLQRMPSLIEAGLVDCKVALPSQIFFSTQMRNQGQYSTLVQRRNRGLYEPLMWSQWSIP